MAEKNFQSDNGVLIIDHTKISTPTNILIKGTNQAPERRNLLYKNLLESDCTSASTRGIILVNGYGNSAYFMHRYGSRVIFSNKGSNERSFIKLEYHQILEYLDPATAGETYTLTFKINDVKNINGNLNLSIFNGTGSLTIHNDTRGTFSIIGNISKYQFDNNWTALIAADITTDKILVRDEDAIIEIELISLEVGDHRNDPLLYMPESPYEQSIINNIEETPFISNNSLTNIGEYRLEGEVSLFFQQIENLIAETYDFFKPSKQELNISYTFLRR